MIQPQYNEANLLEQIDVWIRQAVVPPALLAPASADAHAVTNIDYDAHGKRLLIEHGNGASTTYTYDPETFRLTTLTTTRPNADPNARAVQALAYFYDAVGNITRLRDDADIHNVIYFGNQRVEPSADYSYDPLYRLKTASGREHLGQNAGVLNAPVQVTNDDSLRTKSGPNAPLPTPGDGKAMGNYTENYTYDVVSNILAMVHQVAGGNWTRRYAYVEPSVITPAETSNRLSTTSMPGDLPAGPYSATYSYDQHGNMATMPHLPRMTWDEYDRLQSTTRQVVVSGMPETTFYAYDGEGQRVRKATLKQAASGVAPVLKAERIYLGAFEIYREYSADGTTVTLERETLHVMDDKARVALVETRTVGIDRGLAQAVRYQFSNHLGSAVLELDETADVISYEEYFPYGATAYQAVRSLTETPKRYRYTGKERDEENDLYYHGARYYAPWLGRWTACDPAGLIDGLNLYAYVSGRPIAMVDSQGTNGDSPDVNERDIVYQISQIQRPGDVASFWESQARPNRSDWSHPLSQLEQGYVRAFGDPSTPEAIRMRSAVDPANLNAEERAASARLFGTGEGAAGQYANYENRRRILAHYVFTHPATVNLELGLYRLVRDINPIHFALERGWQIGSGREMFTQRDVSRIGAAAEFLVSLAVIYGVGRALNTVRPVPEHQVPTGPQRELTAPIYDMPQQGGGMQINSRWYSEHALERMAADTPQIRAELRTRTAARLERLGITPGQPAYDRIMGRALARIDPRGIPPSVVEAEIANPGSTSVRVITARRGQVVVTVTPR